MSSKGILEEEIGLIPPSKGRTIASLSGSNIKIPAGSITDIMYKLIRPSPIVLIGVLAIFGLGEGEVAFAGWLELGQLVDLVLCQEAPVVVADVGVATSAV